MKTAADPAALTGLRRFNAIIGLVHAAQAAVVLALANGFALPVTASYMSGPPGTEPGPLVVIGHVRVAWGVFAFLVVSALAHWWIVSPTGFRRYGQDLARTRNIARWVEYSVSATIMILLIAQLCGITDVAALVVVAAVNAAMIFFGWLQERYEEPGGGGWLPFVFGCIAGVAPWVAIAVYVVAPGSVTSVEPPGFVYGIIVSLFVFFNVFALNQWLQYRRIGPWRDYLVGERVYIWLSLTAKSALAWQVFAGALAS